MRKIAILIFVKIANFTYSQEQITRELFEQLVEINERVLKIDLASLRSIENKLNNMKNILEITRNNMRRNLELDSERNRLFNQVIENINEYESSLSRISSNIECVKNDWDLRGGFLVSGVVELIYIRDLLIGRYIESERMRERTYELLYITFNSYNRIIQMLDLDIPRAEDVD